MSYSARTNPRPNRPPAGSSSGTRSTSRSIPPGSVSGVRSCAAAKSGPNAAARSPRRRASTCSASSEHVTLRHEVAPVGRASCPGIGCRSSAVCTIPLPAASASAVKNPATPFRMVMSGSPFTVPSNRKRNSQASPCCTNSSMWMS